MGRTEASAPTGGDDDGCHLTGVGGGRYGEGGTHRSRPTEGWGVRGVGGIAPSSVTAFGRDTFPPGGRRGVSYPFAIRPGLRENVAWVRRAGRK